jgi:hypothetical protein
MQDPGSFDLMAVKKQGFRTQELVAVWQQQVLTAAQEAVNGMVAFLRFRPQAQYLADSVKEARRALELAIAGFRGGAIDYTPVFVAQQFLTQQNDLALAQGKAARGRCWCSPTREDSGARTHLTRESVMHLDFWDYVTFATFAIIGFAGVLLGIFMLGLPGRIAIARKHPEAEAVRLMGYLGFLAVVPWIQAFMWAFKPTDIVDVRRLPAAEARAIEEEIARLRGREPAKPAPQESPPPPTGHQG